MDWKLERQRREKIQENKKIETDQNVNIMSEMEREFELIFGGVKAGFFGRHGQAGDPVRRNEHKAHNRD